MSSIRLRTVLPIIVPAAVLAVGCWWYYYRKKKQNQEQPKSESVQVDSAINELLSTEVPGNSSSAQQTEHVRVPRKPWRSSLHSASSSKLEIPVRVLDVNGTSRDCIQHECDTQNITVCPSQQSLHQMFNAECNGIVYPIQSVNPEDGVLEKVSNDSDSKPLLQSSAEQINKIVDPGAKHDSNDVNNVSASNGDSSYDCDVPASDSASSPLEYATKLLDMSEPLMENSNILKDELNHAECQQVVVPQIDEAQESIFKTLNLMGNKVQELCSTEKISQVEAVQQIVLVQESSKESPVKERSCVKLRGSGIKVFTEGYKALEDVECVRQEKNDPMLGVEFTETEELPIQLTQNFCPKVERDCRCTILESDTVPESLDDGSTKMFFGNYEAKIVEQLAINIISKVIVAAKQEILAGAANDLSDGDLVYLLKSDECMAEQSPPFYLEQNLSTSHEESDSFSTKDSACESTQTELSQVDDLGNVDIEDKICIVENHQDVARVSVCEKQEEPSFSPVHRNSDSFDAQATVDDSSMSACTSEDGIGMEDPLQSTVLSSLGIRSYDSLSTSGIELSRDQISVHKKKAKKDRAVKRKTGHSKKSSLDQKCDGPSTSETEVDQSGGSDVNSMDSTESGRAVEKITGGETEELQTMKTQQDPKNAQLVVWEIEVPKHLVGRLIGKQGRFVSYLKETSGAKIYVTTLPYTQDFQLCHIEGSQEEVDIALTIIAEKFRDLDLTNFYQPRLMQGQSSLPTTSWLVLPEGVTVEVVVTSISSPTHMFIQQTSQPTYHALLSLDQQMFFCYMEPGIPTLPTPVEVGTICAAPNENVWWRAQIVSYFPTTEEVCIRYVDYGGYKRVKISTLRQIRSDFVTLPFQGTEVFLDNIAPLHGDSAFSAEATAAVSDMIKDLRLFAQVTNYDFATNIQMIQLWSLMGEEVVSLNTTIVERGFARWHESY
ncbi:A-kinase anchor protein 1, mitochondrial [Pelodytes ibericus]